jgi:hypothetical protein
MQFPAYGLSVRSEALSLWAPAPVANGVLPEVCVRVEPSRAEVADEWGPLPPEAVATDGVGALAIAGLGRVQAERGASLALAPASDAELGDLRALVTGLGLGLISAQLGRLTLHGSCVAWGERAVCLVGDPGAGKTTLAVRCMASGLRCVSDAMTVCELRERACRVWPGPPFVRLWPDALRLLGEDPERFEAVSSKVPKRIVPLAGHDPLNTALLSAVVVISETAPSALTPLTPARAVAVLAQNLYLSEYLGAEAVGAWLPRLGQLVRETPVFTMSRGEGRAGADQIRELLSR